MIEGIRRLRKYVCEHTHENVSGPSNDFDNSARPLDVLTIADAIEREVEERYIEGPKDKDGMPIHIGDKVCTAHGGTYEVARITREDYDGTTTWYIEDFASHNSLGPEDLTHYKPPTGEDKLWEYANILVKSAMMYSPCDWCPYKDDEDACDCDTLPMRDGCKFNDELRKLGVEVAG